MQQKYGESYMSIDGNEIFHDTVGYWENVEKLSLVRTAYLGDRAEKWPVVSPEAEARVFRQGWGT